jgi:hypothetical protein
MPSCAMTIVFTFDPPPSLRPLPLRPQVYMGLNQITGELFAIKKIDLARECGAVNLDGLDSENTRPYDGTATRPWDHNAKQVP